ncbi:CbtA family protein [Streptomyces sp. YIM 98790]|uniref:CbtA family protein n=1 Tax=Streptomyces sp. YIM 98790 TaxID=2689077 RepID=UPI00140C91E4|nr:CbtA family protein [Streptomyces sp. YIM 98790]
MTSSAPSPVLPLLVRGLAAGGLAGLLSGLFSLLVAGPLLDRAIALEEERLHAGRALALAASLPASLAHGETEVFSRGTQHFGLVVTAVVTGLALGVFFGIGYALLHRRTALSGGDHWTRALALAGAGFLALSLLPGLRYPANPPGVGDAGTVGDRQLLWLAAMFLGVAGTAAAWRLHRRLAARPAPVRHLAVALVLLATVTLLFALPPNPDPVDVPAALLWDFRLLSFAGHAVLWAALGAAFGWLGLRYDPASRAAADTAPAAGSATGSAAGSVSSAARRSPG